MIRLPRRILLSGGGIRGLAHIGALQELQKRGFLAFVKEWAGVSAGSILALMLVLGYTLTELKNFCEQFDFTNIVDLDDAPSMVINFGLDTGERMKRLLEALLKEKGYPVNLTFEELANRKRPNLRIFATDLNKGEIVVFSIDKSPQFKVVDAVRASSSLPVYFQPVVDTFTGNILVDGGVISNYPFLYLTEKEKEETLGLNLKKKVEIVNELDPSDYFYRPVLVSMREISKLEESLFCFNTISIETSITNPLMFQLKLEDKEILFKEGQFAVERFLKNRVPIRRWSVS